MTRLWDVSTFGGCLMDVETNTGLADSATYVAGEAAILIAWFIAALPSLHFSNIVLRGKQFFPNMARVAP